MTASSLFTFVLLSSYILIGVLSGCNSSITFTQGNNQCQFIFKWNSAISCSNPVFNYCQYNSCIYSPNLQGIVCNPMVTTNNWQNCINNCCPSATNSTIYTMYDKIQSCANPSLTQSNPYRVIIITFTILGGVLFSLLLGYWVYKCKKQRITTNVLVAGSNPEVAAKLKKIRPVKEEESLQELAIQWKGSDRELKGDVDCTICLEPEPNLQLECGHLFHPRCFREWNNKKNQCGVCRKTDLKKFKLYCNKCFQSQAHISYRQFKRSHLVQIRCLKCQPA